MMVKIHSKAETQKLIGRIATGALVAPMLALIVAGGCQRESNPPATSAVAAAQSDPKVMFDEIVAVFRNEVESDPPRFATVDDGKFASLTTESTVSHQLTPPTDSDPVYRATITIYTKSRFTFRPAPKEKSEEKDGSNNNLDDWDEDSEFGFDSLGGLGAIGDGVPAAKPGEAYPQGLMEERKDEYEQVYELAFEDGRWVLKTEPDEKTEKFIKATFDFALGRQ